jgi:hypothetical protein
MRFVYISDKATPQLFMPLAITISFPQRFPIMQARPPRRKLIARNSKTPFVVS